MEKLDERTYKFALRIIKPASALSKTTTGSAGTQVLRSGTSLKENYDNRSQ